MSDIVDRAQEREQVNLHRALRSHAERAAVRAAPLVVDGKRVCTDCFDPLTKKRLKANPDAVRCVDCQELKEKQFRRKR